MQFTTCGALGMTGANRHYQTFSRKPCMRLEDEAPEETKIRDLEKQISDARRKGERVDSLLDERRRTYESWIARLDRELSDAEDERVRDGIKRQREHVINDYGSTIA